MRRLLRSQRGSAALEFAVAAPVLMLLVVGLLQFGLWYHARQVAIGAAQEGARLAAAEGGTLEAAERRATDVLRSGLGKLARDPAVYAQIGPEDVSVTVKGTITGLLPIPGLREFRIDTKVDSYRERFRPQGSDR